MSLHCRLNQLLCRSIVSRDKLIEFHYSDFCNADSKHVGVNIRCWGVSNRVLRPIASNHMTKHDIGITITLIDCH